MAEQVETFGSNPQIIETWFVYNGGKEVLPSDGAGEISAVNDMEGARHPIDSGWRLLGSLD
jgi:hypothetical protein